MGGWGGTPPTKIKHYNTSMHTYSVSEFTARVEGALRSAFAAPVSLEGEVSNFKASSNGHWYFTLKDSKSAVQVVMFKGANSAIKSAPRNGDTTLIVGEVAFYKERGQFQIICTFLTTRGLGAILARLEALKQQCKEAGLFDESRKKPLPPLPRKVGIVTSREAAAFEDIKRTFAKNQARLHGFVFHCSVQGDEAARDIARQIAYANEMHPYLDVLLLSRGGGSIEDLLPFSDERVIHAVADSHIPVISAVGHEVDMPLCEYAADIRAHTPTDGAEIICKALRESEEHVLRIKNNLYNDFRTLIDDTQYLVQQFSPTTLIRAFLDKARAVRQSVDYYTEHMHTATRHACRYSASNIEKMKQFIHSSSPQAVLAKGYALIYNRDKTHMHTSARALEAGTNLVITMKDGERPATIQGQHEK